MYLCQMTARINVTHFTDYRSFLQAHIQDMKQHKRSWSFGSWANTMGLKTTSSITKIIRGQRHPGPEITRKLIHYFKFNSKNAQYFRDLVHLEKIKNDPLLSVLLMEKIGKQHPDSRTRIMDDKSFLIISNWYFLALRELIRIQGFKEDPLWIAEQFIFKTTSRDISNAIKTLIEMQLIRRDENGKLVISEGRIDTTSDIASEAIKRYHEQMLEHAKTAVRRFSTEQRELTSTTLLMKSNKINEAKELIREFKSKFEQIMEEESGDQVFQIQIQLFPVTNSIKTKKELL